MRVLVTGGAGFIGSNLVRLLVEKKQEVVVLDDLSSGYPENLAPFPGIRFVEGDICSAEVVRNALAGVDVVFHLAASVGNARSIEDPIRDSEINVIGTLRVLEAARHARVRKLVFSSSAGIFGELKTLPILEDHPAEPRSPYGASKLAAEKHCLAYAHLYGIEVVCLRYFNVYGVNQRYDLYGNVIPIFAHRLLRGIPLVIYGDGEQTRDFANVRDVAQANYRAATTPGATGAFNIGSGTRVTINELVRLMEKASGIRAEVEYASPRPSDVRDSLTETAAARRAFGYEPSISLDEGLHEYMEWAKSAQGGTP
jgi:UDP-glucose 4-epimerase